MASYRLSNNSSNSQNSHGSIQYNDRLYSSASQALEDYIKDYNLSLASPEVKLGKICVNHSTPRDFWPSKDSFQQKYGHEAAKLQERSSMDKLKTAVPHRVTVACMKKCAYWESVLARSQQAARCEKLKRNISH